LAEAVEGATKSRVGSPEKTKQKYFKSFWIM
jgi:hypothetical protein